MSRLSIWRIGYCPTPRPTPGPDRDTLLRNLRVGASLFDGRWHTRSARRLGLRVPSVVEPLERNLLLNPAHAQYGRIVLTVERDPFSFDGRL